MLPRKHARTHAPGGSDPLPSTATSVYRNPATVFAIEGHWFEIYNQDSLDAGFSVVNDSAAPFGAYYQSTSQNDYFIVGFPLGPNGSRWAVDLWWSTGTDYGLFDLEWQTTTADVTGESSESIDTAVPAGTWYKTGSPTTWQIDAYAASPNVLNDTQLSLMTITGADGDMLSADGSASGVFTNTQEMNGGGDGSVWWWLRLKVKSKNASSSGYRCRIHALRVRRVASGGISTL